MSRLRRYRALSLDACVAAARGDFGPDAVIHATRTLREKSSIFRRRRTIHELLAGPASEVAAIAKAGSTGRAPSVAGSAAIRAYGARRDGAARAGAGAAASGLARGAVSREAGACAPAGLDPDGEHAGGVTELDRRRTKLLAQAMALRFEREGSMRVAAEKNAKGTDRAVALGAKTPRSPGSPSDMTVASAAAAPAPALADHAQRFVLVPAGSSMEWARAQGTRVSSEGAEIARSLQAEIAALKQLVAQVLQCRDGDDRAAAGALTDPGEWSEPFDTSAFGAPLAGLYATLLGQAMAARLARQVIEEARDALGADAMRNPDAARAAVALRIAHLLPPCEPPDASLFKKRRGRRGPHVIAMIGPTGAGKTTTIAKVASTLALRENLKVGLVTTDTFRIAAVEQLRTYADIVGLPLKVAEGAAGVRTACRELADRDVLLVDTAGRGHGDQVRIDELKSLVQAAAPKETHLVLSSAAGERTLLAEAESFARVGVDRVVLAKLDETVGFGILVNALRRIRHPLSYLTTGQEVPNDLEAAQPGRLADLVVGGCVR